MRRSTFSAALLAMAFGVTAGTASARPDDRDHDRRGRDPGRRGPDDDRRGRDHHARRDDDRRGPPRHAHDDRRGPPRHGHPHGRPPGHAYGHRWQRGERLPPTYRTRHYVVNNWNAYHLHRPPRGYQWVQVGADFVLIAIATGLIAQVVLSN